MGSVPMLGNCFNEITRFKKLNEKFDGMPEIIQDCIGYTKNRKIPSTKNLAELLFGVTFLKKQKQGQSEN